MDVAGAVREVARLFRVIIQKFAKTVDQKIRMERWKSRKRAKDYLKELRKDR